MGHAALPGLLSVDGNRTQDFGHCTILFSSDPHLHNYQVLHSGIYELETPVYIEGFVYEKKEGPMTREYLMQERILEKWKELGMTKEDIGIIFDLVEIPLRDFLLAAQLCEVPNNNWRTDKTQPCQAPLVRMSTPMFEGLPKCIHKGSKQKGGSALMIMRVEFPPR